MRADRLLSMLMVLQMKGKQTARQLAGELCVSERTIYRDIEALSISGVPIYTDPGPNGGIALVENYRTTLTGMKLDEIRALFMISVHPLFSQLGIHDSLRDAINKISSGLPLSQKTTAQELQRRIYVDPLGWKDTVEEHPLLPKLHKAVWEDRWVEVLMRLKIRGEIKAKFMAYGLVAKGSSWNFIFSDKQGQFHVLPVKDILAVQVYEESFTREDSFHIARFWKEWLQRVRQGRASYDVLLRVNLKRFREMPFFWVYLHQLDLPDDNDLEYVDLRLSFESFHAAREKILGFGSAVEVLEPQPLRLSVKDYASQILKLYA